MALTNFKEKREYKPSIEIQYSIKAVSAQFYSNANKKGKGNCLYDFFSCAFFYG
jgi:hypothetical protein